MVFRGRCAINHNCESQKRKYKLTEKFNTEEVACSESMFVSAITLTFHTNFLDIGLM